MTTKDKIILILLSLITLGIYPLVVFRKKEQTKNNEISTSEKLKINLDKLQTILGGSENIAGTEYTNTKVKIFVHDKKIVELEEISKIQGISGVFASSKYITVIVGKQAKLLATSL